MTVRGCSWSLLGHLCDLQSARNPVVYRVSRDSRPHCPTQAGTLNPAFGVTYVTGPTRTRTWDLVVISDALCQLSYEPPLNGWPAFPRGCPPKGHRLTP